MREGVVIRNKLSHKEKDFYYSVLTCILRNDGSIVQARGDLIIGCDVR